MYTICTALKLIFMILFSDCFQFLNVPILLFSSKLPFVLTREMWVRVINKGEGGFFKFLEKKMFASAVSVRLAFRVIQIWRSWKWFLGFLESQSRPYLTSSLSLMLKVQVLLFNQCRCWELAFCVRDHAEQQTLKSELGSWKIMFTYSFIIWNPAQLFFTN